MRKFLILITSLLLINVTAYFYSCTKACRGSAINNCYSLKYISLSAYDRSPVQFSQEQKVKWSDFYLGLRITYNNSSTCHIPSVNPLINVAYACDPAINSRYKDSIIAVGIFSDHDFDSTHRAGHILNDYFSGTEIEQFNKGYGDDSISFILKQMPADTGKHTFSVIMDFSNGVTMKVEATPVIIIK